MQALQSDFECAIIAIKEVFQLAMLNMPLDGKGEKQTIAISLDSELIKTIDAAVNASQILQFLNDRRGGIEQIENPRKRRLFTSKENRSSFVEKVLRVSLAQEMFRHNEQNWSIIDLAQMYEKLAFALGRKNSEIAMRYLLRPKNVDILNRKTQVRYSQEDKEKILAMARQHFIKQIENGCTDRKAAMSVLENCFSDASVRFGFHVCCLTQGDVNIIFDNMEDIDSVFEFDHNALVEYSTMRLEADLGIGERRADRITKIEAFENEVDQLLQKKTSDVAEIMPLRETVITRDMAVRCLAEALVCFSKNTKANSVDHLCMYAGLKNWGNRFDEKNPYRFPLLSFYLQHAFKG